MIRVARPWAGSFCIIFTSKKPHKPSVYAALFYHSFYGYDVGKYAIWGTDQHLHNLLSGWNAAIFLWVGKQIKKQLFPVHWEFPFHFSLINGLRSSIGKITKKARVETTVLNSLTLLSKAEICKIPPDVENRLCETERPFLFNKIHQGIKIWVNTDN